MLYAKLGSQSTVEDRSDCQVLAQFCRTEMGRAGPLYPGISDVHLLCYRKRIIGLDTQVSDGALNLLSIDVVTVRGVGPGARVFVRCGREPLCSDPLTSDSGPTPFVLEQMERSVGALGMVEDLER